MIRFSWFILTIVLITSCDNQTIKMAEEDAYLREAYHTTHSRLAILNRDRIQDGERGRFEPMIVAILGQYQATKIALDDGLAMDMKAFYANQDNVMFDTALRLDTQKVEALKVSYEAHQRYIKDSMWSYIKVQNEALPDFLETRFNKAVDSILVVNYLDTDTWKTNILKANSWDEVSCYTEQLNFYYTASEADMVQLVASWQPYLEEQYIGKMKDCLVPRLLKHYKGHNYLDIGRAAVPQDYEQLYFVLKDGTKIYPNSEGIAWCSVPTHQRGEQRISIRMEGKKQFSERLAARNWVYYTVE